MSEKKDVTIICIDREKNRDNGCEGEFRWTWEQQEYFQKNQLKPPKRCIPCRRKRKLEIVKKQMEEATNAGY